MGPCVIFRPLSPRRVHTSPADSPAACSFSTLMICSSVNLLLRMSVSRRNGLYLNSGAFMGSRSLSSTVADRALENLVVSHSAMWGVLPKGSCASDESNHLRFNCCALYITASPQNPQIGLNPTRREPTADTLMQWLCNVDRQQYRMQWPKSKACCAPPIS